MQRRICSVDRGTVEPLLDKSRLAIVSRQNTLRWKASLIAASLLSAPGLVLQITVDALRGDLPGRYSHLFGDGGFRYLMNRGVHYTNAHYQHTNGKAKIFGVSVKDRGAVSLAGHAGKAFWFSKAGGEFVTSSYYYDQYPD